MAMKHGVYDSDTHFSINPITRALQNEGSAKTSLIQYDHNSERFTFEIPRYIEGHDMSLSNVIQVHYNNIDVQTKEQSKGVYNVDDMQISPDGDDVVILSWLISHHATQYVGSLNFLIRFSCVDEDSNLFYAWNTAIYSGITVSNGIYNGDALVEEYADILDEWHKELLANEITRMEQTQVGSGDGGVNIWTATFGDGRIANFEVRNGSKGDKGDKGDGVVLVTEDELNALIANGEIIDGVTYAVTDDTTIPQLQADMVKAKEDIAVTLKHTAQYLTNEQKAQVIANLGLDAYILAKIQELTPPTSYVWEKYSVTKGEYIGTSENDSPKDGITDGYYYEYDHEEVTKVYWWDAWKFDEDAENGIGDKLVSPLTSKNPTEYPDSGWCNYFGIDVWTEYQRDSNRDPYTTNDYQYISIMYELAKDSFIEKVTADNLNAYPIDGYDAESGYWYVLVAE